MKRILLFSIFYILVISCHQNENGKKVVDPIPAEKKFKMYQMSAMALLMEQMYVENQRLKIRIEKGEALGIYPKYYNKIFTSKFTDSVDNDAFFKENARHYIEVQKKLYSESKNVKENYNKGVNACIICHQGKCGGPLTKIKKLILK